MVYKNNNAVMALNSYVWKLLEANLGWKKTDYNGIVPIVPLSQQPELLVSGKAFLIYGNTMHPATHLYQLKSEAVAYTIYATTVTEANKIVQLLVDAFERQDEAAADVNEWLTVEQAGGGSPRGISFGSIRTAMSQKAEPADEEGGRVASYVLLEMRYTAPNQTIQTSGFIYP